MNDRKDPEGEPCPNCTKVGQVEQSITVSPISMSCTLEAARAISKLNNGSALKDRIQRIHDNTPGSTLNRTSNFLDIK